MEPFFPPSPLPLAPSAAPAGGAPASSMPPEGDLAAGLADLFSEPDALPDEAAIDPEASLPAEERTLKLSPSERDEIARFLVELLIEHDAAYKSRWEREQAIEDAYAMPPDPARQGPQPHAVRLCSELTKSQVDQAKARIVVWDQGRQADDAGLRQRSQLARFGGSGRDRGGDRALPPGAPSKTCGLT